MNVAKSCLIVFVSLRFIVAIGTVRLYAKEII